MNAKAEQDHGLTGMGPGAGSVGLLWKRKECPVDNRERIWIWSAAALSFVAGLVLVLNGSSAGWIFFIIGIGYVGASTRAGRAWATTNPALAKWGLVVATALLFLLVVIVGALLLLK
jgi:hypothetical protein